MTQKEFNDKKAKIKEQETALGVTIEIDQCIDKDHLDCTWYGGDVGTISGYKGFTIVISAVGDIRIRGRIAGEEIEIADKCNGGRMYHELARTYDLDDKKLEELLCAGEGVDEDDTDVDYLIFENNNWFEADLITPDGDFIDLGFSCDNILDNNLLDCFVDAQDHFELVDWYLELPDQEGGNEE